MAVTRIKNNQITDSSAGNAIVGINASTKVQDFSITAGKIANSLVYGSDLTVTGNLTVNGQTTTIDTVSTVIEDPVIVLAANQTGAPTVDIGFIGERGTSNNIAFVWDESSSEFVTAFTTDLITNTTVTISSYANFHTFDANIGGNLAVGGNVSFTGNVTSLNVTGNLAAGNVNTAGQVVATGNVTGGNVSAGAGIISTTGNINGGNVNATNGITAGTTVIATGNVSGGNLTTAGITSTGSLTASTTINATGNVSGGNLTTAGITSTGSLIASTTIDATGNITGGNVSAGAGIISTTGNINGANVNATGNITGTGAVFSGNVTASNFIGNISGNVDAGGANTNIQFNDNEVLAGSAAFTFDKTSNAVSVSGNITGGNLTTAGITSTGSLTAATTINATANITGGNLTTTGITSTGSLTATTTIDATGNITGGNLTTTGITSTGSLTATTTINATGNATVGNLITTGVTKTGTLETTGNALIGGNLIVQGNVTYININDLRVEDPIIILGTGPNGAPLTTNDGLDRGIYMEYFVTSGNVAANAFMGYDNSTGNMFIASNVFFTANDIVGVNSYGTLEAGNLYIQSAVSTGNISGGNLTTAGITSTGSLTAATTINATGNITGGNLSAGSGIISTTGNINGANVNASAGITAGTTVIATGNVSGGNLTTAGITSTGSLTATTTINATGNITGGNILTSGAGGSITGTGNINGANVNATGNITGTGAVFSGNVTAANFIGNISGNIDAGGANTNIQFNDNEVLAGSAAFTFDKTSNAVIASGNISAGNLISNGAISAATTINATGNITGGNLTTTGITSTGSLTASTTIDATGNITGGNVSAGAGIIVTTGNITGGNIATAGQLKGGNIVISGDDITDTNGRVNFNTAGGDVDFAVNGDTVANIFFIDAGTGTASFGSATQTTNSVVAFNSTNSILVPVGNTQQRPTGITGQFRFNTTTNAIEVYDNTEWTSVGVPVFTVIDDQQFNGDGSTVAFTINSNQTTNSCIVSINGVVQIPTIAYAVVGTTLTFTEAPLPGDLIDVRQLTTTTTVTSISNSSGNAAISVTDVTANVGVTGNLVVAGTISANGFIGLDATAITNGTSNMTVVSSGGNIRANIAGTTVQTISAGLVAITGDLSVSGNATLSGNILGDRIQNGTTSFDIQTPSGNANITIGATSNVAVFSTTGLAVAGTVSVSGTGNVTGANIVATADVFTPEIVKTGSNAVGNIGQASNYFNTVFAQATSALYADLAEKYTADAEYVPGTVVVFGGDKEVTVTSTDADRAVAGVVSTNPSYIMNAGLEAEHVATVALTGRVPTRVTGTVHKGDLMVSAGYGLARAEQDPRVGTVIGKALENHEGTEGVIEVVVGRF
jgi:filamentous hemagglutinin